MGERKLIGYERCKFCGQDGAAVKVDVCGKVYVVCTSPPRGGGCGSRAFLRGEPNETRLAAYERAMSARAANDNAHKADAAGTDETTDKGTDHGRLQADNDNEPGAERDAGKHDRAGLWFE